MSVLQPLQTGQNDIIIDSETKNPYREHKIDALHRLNQDLVIGTISSSQPQQRPRVSFIGNYRAVVMACTGPATGPRFKEI